MKMADKLIGNEKNVLFYNNEDGNVQIEVLLENEDVWLNTDALAKLFNINRSGIVKHINNIYKDDELSKAHVQKLHMWVMMVDKPIIQNIIILI